MDLHCQRCHGWKYSHDNYCGGFYCLKYERFLNKEINDWGKEQDIVENENDSLTKG